MSDTTFGFKRVKGVALAATDAERAKRSYGETLGLPPEYKGDELLGYDLGGTIIMPRVDWHGTPTEEPNYRVTIEVDDSRRTEAALVERGVRISDPVEDVGKSHIGSFLDSEGNKLWFCSMNP